MAIARSNAGNQGTIFALVVFVIIAVLTTVLAVLFYLDSQKVKEASANRTQEYNTYIRENERNRYNELRLAARDTDKSVVAYLADGRDSLAEMVAGDEKLGVNTINTKLQRTLEQLSADKGKQLEGKSLLFAVEQLGADLAAAQDQNTGLGQRLSQLQQEIQALADSRTAIETAHETQMKRLEDEKASLLQTNSDTQSEKDALVGGLQDQLRTANEGLRDQQRQFDAQLQSVQAELAMVRSLNEKFKGELEKLRPKFDPLVVAERPDGQVLSVLPAEGMAFIDLGRENLISKGMTFEVYSEHTGVTPADKGRGKASLEVTNAGPYSSEVRIMRTTPGDPVIVGDVIANVVYDPNRKYTFMVVGDFDLNNDGRVDPNGKDVIKQMVRNFGGVLTDKIELKTEFLVMGADLDPPIKPSSNADPLQRRRYEVARKQFDKFTQLKADAAQLSIPVLNQTRFFHFVGHVQ